MKKLSGVLSFVTLLVFTTGCDTEGRGFALPPGDAEAGKATFVELACGDCHSVRGEEPSEITREVHVVLGGQTTRVRSYGELVTSIINPSHRLARAVSGDVEDDDGVSQMRNYNAVMTVQQLVDLVTYLQTEYEVIVPRTNYY